MHLHNMKHEHEIKYEHEDDGTSPKDSNPTHAPSCHSTSSSLSDHHGDIISRFGESEADFEISGTDMGKLHLMNSIMLTQKTK